jgi:asparagine synthase (glutamine-hydrolysing)
MCGIAGKINFNTDQPVEESLLRRMSGSVAHRGPDEDGWYLDESRRVGFAHRRLSIIDLSGGRQPMTNASRNAWVVFNGEIYNYRELRKELIDKGYQFLTRSDTEVILNLYAEYGESGFERLNGIFTFAIHDVRQRKVVLARDHFGVKPLYYMSHNGSLLFGSEIKAVLEERSYRRELDYDALNTFLTFRYNPSPGTLFKGILKLPPGHSLSVGLDGTIETRSYWRYCPVTNSRITERDAVEEYKRLLELAVSRQMVSDVPVGLFLSGGIDSAIVGYLMQRQASSPIKTFSIGFPGHGDYNELEDARASAAFIGSDHHELVLSSADYLNFLPQSYFFTEEPIAEATIPALYYVSRLAAKQLKVVLAGQGADEPLAGYHRYVGESYVGKYAPILKYLPLQSVAALLPRNERLKRAAYASSFTRELERFLGIYTIFTPEQKQRLFHPDLADKLQAVDFSSVERLYGDCGGLADSLSKLLFIDTRLSLSDNLLIFGDKMTMANSLEMRVPFLDVELVKFLESLPSTLKLKGTTGKYIHKQALRSWLPASIIGRKKRGFSTPIDEWLQGPFVDRVREIVNQPDSVCARYFNLPFVNQLLARHQSRRENYNRHILALLSFDLWHRTCFEGKQPEHDLLTRARPLAAVC